MSAAQTIRRDSASYRQGVVLGLTMAETLLLLVFCLLIAAASIFSHNLKQVKDLEASNQNIELSLREAQSTIELMQSQMPDGVISDDWKRIVRDYGPAIKKLQEADVSIKDVADTAPFIAQVMKAYKEGGADDVTGSIILGNVIKEQFPATPGGIPKPQEVAQLIRTGLEVQAKSGASQATGRHNWPPIITLSEANGHYFDTGSAVLSPEFRAALAGPIIEQLLGIIKNYPDVNVIEVIGHTDEQPIVRRPSNLDQMLNPVLQDRASIVRLTPADNAGLGLARAVSVSQVLLQDMRLYPYFSILPYSAAQLVDVDDTLSRAGTGADVRQRRRIEIRLRKSDKLVILSPGALTTSIPKKRPVEPASPQPRPANVEVPQPESAPGSEEGGPPGNSVRPAAAPPKTFQPFRWMFGN
jgi:outer membrane protein OmpA-like peptidoglycan-associated protein